MGGILEQGNRKQFNDFLLQLIFYVDVRTSYDLRIELEQWEPRGLTLDFKDGKNLFSYKLDVATLSWSQWLQKSDINIAELTPLKFEELIIPTNDSERNAYFIKESIENQLNVLLTGPTGTGKTVSAISIVTQFYSNEKYCNILTNFSGQTLVNSVQKQIENKMTTRKGRKGTWGPEESKEKLIIYIDDINMPAKEVYGAQPPIELLRMWNDYQFWYDLETKEEKTLLGMQFVSTMGPPSSGRNTVTARFLKQFFLQYVISFDDDSMKRIYESILDWHFTRSSPKFLNTFTQMKVQIVQASIDLYAKIKKNNQFLPTPKKSHYIFSMRDITRVFQTISKITFRSLKREQDFVKLWAYESSRVFSDRLVSNEDKNVFNDLLKETTQLIFKIEWGKLVKNEPLLWGDFIPIQIKEKEEKKEISGVYVELGEMETVQGFFNKKLAEYNEEQQDKLNLVLFSEAIEHIVRIIRVITTPNSHCLLVGLGGLGRKSLTSLSCFITQFTVWKIKMSSTYGRKEWVSDLQEILKKAGAENIESVFLFQDSEIFQEEMLEEISSLLQQGEVPGIFANEDKAQIIESVTNTYDQEVEGMNTNQKLAFFQQKCRQNLHLCLCFSPVGDDFRRRLRNFPSFINNTTMDWFVDWPDNALQQVAHYYLKDEGLSEEQLQSLSLLCVRMQKDAGEMTSRFFEELRRYYYITPSSYLELLQLFQNVSRKRQKKIENDISNYEKGVYTLKDAQEKVDIMKQDIIELTPKLQEAEAQTKELISTVERESLEVDDKKEKVQKEEIICNSNREKALDLKSQCKSDLEKVEPLLEEASKNLKSIQRNHIDFIKQIKNPLPPIKKLFQGLCTLYDIDQKAIPKIKDPNDPYKKISDYTTPTRNIIMAKPDQMLKELLSYNADSINQMKPEIIKDLKILAQDPDFDLAAITNVSLAAGKIAGFLLTIIEIYDKLLIINPKREALKKAEEELQEAERILTDKQEDLQKLIQKLEDLNLKLKEAKDKSNYLQSEMERCKRQKNAAEELLTGLDGERKQWEQNIIELKGDKETLTGDAAISAGIMAYFGIFPINYRDEYQENWLELMTSLGIKFTDDYKLKNIMSNEIIIGNWTNKYMLPNDSYSVDNAIIMENSNRFCIMIDPQNQANRWLKEMEKENKLAILKPSLKSNEVQNTLQQAIESGFPVLFENLDEKLDFNVTSILKNQRKTVNKKQKFKFLEWLSLHEGFKFYGTTKLSKPHFSPDICVNTTLLNFQVTPLGLEDQLLNILVAKEDPSSEKMRINNIKEFFELRKKQKQTEENILKMLTQKGETNILDDQDLIDALRRSKEDSHTATQRIKVIESMKKKLLNTRNFYSKAANRASNLFFCVTDLGNVEAMYQFSLDWFIDLYKQSLVSENKNKETRIQEIIENFTKLLLKGIIPSLFEKDKLLFSFLMFLKTLECENLTNLYQLRKFFIGGTKLEPKTPNPLPDCLSNKQWAELEELSQSEQSFLNLLEHIKNGINEWTTFIQSEKFAKTPLPQQYSNISDVNHLMLIRIIRPDQVIPLVQEKIASLLGQEFIDFPSTNIEQIYQKSKNTIPVIFILQQGAEPLADIERLSETLGKGKNIDVLSLGQGQEGNAREFLKQAMKKGRWVVLQNCHIAPTFLIELERMLDQVEHNDFRLWLTSIPTNTFPVTLLQKGFKVTSQPPRGIKGNLLKTFSSYTNKLIENHPKSKVWKKLLFGISFFHALVQERRKYSSLGWNIPYEFSFNDLYISLTQTRKMLKDFDDIPWDTLTYSIAEANYGGRVTDPMDRRLIKVILKTFLSKPSLRDDYTYSPSGLYYCPDECDLKTYKKFIQDNIPFQENPEIFGLHPNSEITSGIKETNQMMSTLLDLLPRNNVSNGISLDQQIMIKCKEILEKIPPEFNLEKVSDKYQIEYSNSMNTVLIQELMRYNNLINKITSSITMLIRAIQGLVIMSEELDEVYGKILNNNVPDLWHKVSYPSVKPLSGWISNFLARLKFMQDWIDHGQPSNFWISGFFFTQSFLTSLLQNYARKEKIAIDLLDFDFQILRQDVDTTKPAPEGSYIHGLYLEGAQWGLNEQVLIDSKPKVLFSELPNVWFIPRKIEKINHGHNYSCPVYKTSLRAGTLSTTGHSTNFVISISLPMKQEDNSDFWIKRGVALLCELDN